eukprot:CAMPEP_0176125268 /NCGR_PEP_ID=MMETSP0120_2-20121206/63188_1 /TAXON_ID=160619 /ORGANISM="Kryptoperidinium foliaceum, Strain CCMP 1326" /LENGTH=165 /DNA_ID=CAMNT_0017460109 /DNA_START=790 /DNA_END=1288 /DNA_ORIENTATION=+
MTTQAIDDQTHQDHRPEQGHEAARGRDKKNPQLRKGCHHAQYAQPTHQSKQTCEAQRLQVSPEILSNSKWEHVQVDAADNDDEQIQAIEIVNFVLDWIPEKSLFQGVQANRDLDDEDDVYYLLKDTEISKYRVALVSDDPRLQKDGNIFALDLNLGEHVDCAEND